MGGKMSKEYHAAYNKRNREHRAEIIQAWTEKNWDKNAAYHAKYYRENLARNMLNRARSRANKKSLPFNLEVADIQVPDVCPVLGITLVIGGVSGGPASPSLDRMIPGLGYIKGNVRVISKRANTLLSDGTLLEMEAIIKDIKKRIKVGA